MKLKLPLRTIRARLTFWHLGVVLATLVLFMALGQFFLWNQLKQKVKNSLYDTVEVLEYFVTATPDGELLWEGHDRIATIADRLIDIRYPDGRLIFRNTPDAHFFSKLTPLSTKKHEATFHSFRSLEEEGTHYLVIQEYHKVDGYPFLVQVARSTESIRTEMAHLLAAQVMCFPFVIFMAWGGGYLLAGRALSPVRKIMDRVKRITASELHERLPVESPDDEIGRLSITFNNLLAKLDRSFTQMQQFTSDASHEMRTPLAAIRSVGEVALRTPMRAEEYRETIASMLEEVERMSCMVDDLLALARSDSDQANSLCAEVDLEELVREVVALLDVLAEEKKQKIDLKFERPARVRLDRKVFRHALVNVLHNAIKFTPEGGEIELQGSYSGSSYLLEIRDSGPGIDTAHHDKIFDRFYRVDKVRSRETGGSGLGLAIARRSVEGNGGVIDVKSRPGQGCTFAIRLPSV